MMSCRKLILFQICGTLIFGAPQSLLAEKENKSELSAFHLEPSADSGSLELRKDDFNIIEKNTHGNGWNEIRIFVKKVDVWTAEIFLEKNGTFRPDVIFRLEPSAASSKINLEQPRPAGKNTIILNEKKEGFWKKVSVSGIITVYQNDVNISPAPKTENQESSLKIPPVYFSADGILKKMSKPVNNASYKLVFEINGQEYLIAYILDGSIDLNHWAQRKIHVNGTVLRKKGVKVPFLIPRQIHPAWD